MKTTTRNQMYEKIEQHGANLNKIFNTEYDNITLCKKLRRLETKAHKLATDYCNGSIDCEIWEHQSEVILEKLAKILGEQAQSICFVNGDCRGYALKIYDEVMRHSEHELYKDWGGYGILAPDFSN